MAEKEYKWVGDHPQDLEGGQVLAPGDIVTLDDSSFESPFMQELRDSGLFLDLSAEQTTTKEPTSAERKEREATAGTGSGKEQ